MEKIKTIECPQCKKVFKINLQMAGKSYRCKICSGIVTIPSNIFDDQENLLDEIPSILSSNPPIDDINKPNESSNKISLRTAIGALALIVVSFLSYIALGPFITMYQIKSGIVRGDSEALNENIEFPTLRENLKSQLNVSLMKKMASDLKDNPFAALGLGLAGKLTDGMVDSFVSPAGLSALLEGNRPNVNSQRLNENKEISFTEFLRAFEYSFDSPNKFVVWMKSEDKAKFILSRQGFGWKLTNILMSFPENNLETLAVTNTKETAKSKTKKEPELANLPETEVHSLNIKQLRKRMQADENKLVEMGKFISLLNQPNGDIRCGAIGPDEKLKAIMKSEDYYLVTTIDGERGWVHSSWLQETP
jgi:hypothetical protein